MYVCERHQRGRISVIYITGSKLVETPVTASPVKKFIAERYMRPNRSSGIVKKSMLEEYLEEHQGTINEMHARMVEDDYDFTEQEEHIWKTAFAIYISDGYTLSKEDMLDEHDWWIKRLEYHAGLYEEEFSRIYVHLTNQVHLNVFDFLEDVLNSFTVDQLSVASPFA